MSLYDAQGLFYGCNREYSQAINYKIDTVDPSDWTPSGPYSHGSITVKKETFLLQISPEVYL